MEPECLALPDQVLQLAVGGTPRARRGERSLHRPEVVEELGRGLVGRGRDRKPRRPDPSRDMNEVLAALPRAGPNLSFPHPPPIPPAAPPPPTPPFLPLLRRDPPLTP